VTDPRERLIQFKTNIDVVMSCSSAVVSGTGWPIAWSRSATRTGRDPARIDVKHDPFMDDRLKVANLPESRRRSP